MCEWNEMGILILPQTNKAFEKIPEHAPKPSKEVLKKILTYHVVPEFYPAGRVLASHTAPTRKFTKSLVSGQAANLVASSIEGRTPWV